MKTFPELVDSVQEGAVALGMDVSPKDVGWIVSTFLEGLIATEVIPAPQRAIFQRIADECAAVKDE